MASVAPRKVLLVEDELLLVMSVRLLLVRDGRYVVTGHSARLAGALRAVERQTPDIALVDIRLAGGENGLDVAEALSALNIPCLLMSGDPPGAALPGLARGCLAKPFSDGDLLDALAIVSHAARGTAPICETPAALQIY